MQKQYCPLGVISVSQGVKQLRHTCTAAVLLQCQGSRLTCVKIKRWKSAFQTEVFVLKCSLHFLPNLEVTSAVWGFYLFGALGVTSTVWGFGSCICLGLWKSHLFRALEVISTVCGFGSHIICLGLWKSHLLFGAVEVTSVWGFGSHICCLGLWSHICCLGLWSQICCMGLWKST